MVWQRVWMLILLALPMISVGEEATLRIVSYNIRHARGMDDVVDPERIAAVVRGLRPDVVCLQEVDKDQPRSGHIDLTQVLADLLEMEGVFGPNYYFNDGEYGNATLSRYPILEHDNLALPNPDNVEPRGALRTVIEVEGIPVEIWNTHWGLRPHERAEQSSAMLERMADDKSVLVVGDLNEQVGATGVDALLGPLRDTWNPEAGIGTVPVGTPRRRIDYILASPQIGVLEHRIIHDEATMIASDHLPVLAVLTIPRPSAEKDDDPAGRALFEVQENPESPDES